MPVAAPRRHECAAAGAILVLAVLAAIWISRQHPVPPIRIAPPEVATSEDAPAAPPSVIELIELPDAPPPPAAAAPKSAPTPAQRPETPRVKVAMEQPTPPPLASPPPAPEPPPAQQAPAVEVTPIVPLPDVAAAQNIVPLTPETPMKRPSPRTTVMPLRPGDEKPAPRPVVQPLRPEEPPEEPKVEPKIVQAPEPPPSSPPRAEPVKPAPVAEKPKPAAPLIQTAAPSQAAPKPVDEKEVATEGRVLLRMFEQGAGPSIQIRWPAQAGQRDRLYAVFTHCLGMQVGILDDQGHLYLGEGPRNQPLALNTDKYSGFIRRPEGAIAAGEQEEITRIRQYHQAASAAPPARMFPRRVDAFLLGGLRHAVGDQYLKMKSIRAAYRLSGSRVVIESIVADGRAVDGAIDLSTVATSCSE